jgi:hypothetical protein
MYCCLWFTSLFVFRKVLGDFESGFCFKVLLFLGARELENKLFLLPSAISKLVGDLNIGDLDEDLYCIKTDVDSTIVGSPELDKLAQLAGPLCWSHGGDRQRPLPVPHHRWLPV